MPTNLLLLFLLRDILLLFIPLAFLGIIIGIIYHEAPVEEKNTSGKLIASSTLGFLCGFILTPIFLSWAGLWTLLIFTVALTVFLPYYKYSIIISFICALIFFISGLENSLIKITSPPPFFWRNQEAESHKYLFGGWSPYARIDFYEMPDNSLAGLYNGVQQWFVSPSPDKDFDVRKEIYKKFEGDILLIGSGGGQGVVDLSKASSITAVELDPFVVQSLKGKLKKYNNKIYLKHNIITGDGRSFLESAEQKFDYIIYEGTDITVSHLQYSIISFENRLYTREGLKLALRHLKPGGVLFAVHTMSSIPSIRFLSGLPENTETAMWEGVAYGPIPFPSRFIAATYDKDKINMLKKWVREENINFTEINASKLNNDSHFSFGKYITDNRPFLYFTSYKELLPILLSIIIILLFLIISIIFTTPRKLTFYFIFIGCGYMILELYLLSIFHAFFRGYSETFAVIMTCLCLASAAGAITWKLISYRNIVVITLFSIFLACLSSYLLVYSGNNGLIKLFLFLLGTLPAGFTMGLYMPAGLKKAGKKAGIFWGIDALGTALGFALFYLVALVYGFNFTILLAGLFYTGAICLWPKS